jgi:hypothetical protein
VLTQDRRAPGEVRGSARELRGVAWVAHPARGRVLVGLEHGDGHRVGVGDDVGGRPHDTTRHRLGFERGHGVGRGERGGDRVDAVHHPGDELAVGVALEDRLEPRVGVVDAERAAHAEEVLVGGGGDDAPAVEEPQRPEGRHEARVE